MTLASGTRLGPYEILGALGHGGMGEVYRASDTQLKREVAIKVLPEACARDEERMKRFEREAQVLASLNHAQGLEAAHERAVIHRDLKPANVKLTNDWDVKILDFGVAKAIEKESGAVYVSVSPTLTRATQVGVLLGTAAYMSPEQARGKPADRRADVWSFGVVLFEMLTGRRAFSGEDVSETLAHVLTKEPDWSALPPGLPGWLRWLLTRCLAKDPKKRLQAIGEARIASKTRARPHRRCARPSGPPSPSSRPWDWPGRSGPIGLGRRRLPCR